MSDNGLVTLPSIHGVKDTIDRIEADVKSKGMTLFARVDHAAGAREAGLTLAPTLLLILGNAGRHAPDAGEAASRHRLAAQGARLGRRVRGMAACQAKSADALFDGVLTRIAS
jgi:hypothetical protein